MGSVLALFRFGLLAAEWQFQIELCQIGASFSISVAIFRQTSWFFFDKVHVEKWQKKVECIPSADLRIEASNIEPILHWNNIFWHIWNTNPVQRNTPRKWRWRRTQNCSIWPSTLQIQQQIYLFRPNSVTFKVYFLSWIIQFHWLNSAEMINRPTDLTQLH